MAFDVRFYNEIKSFLTNERKGINFVYRISNLLPSLFVCRDIKPDRLRLIASHAARNSAARPIAVKIPVDDLSVGRSVGAYVRLSSALLKNGGSHPDAVWHHRSDESRDEAGGGVWRSF